jgi:DNA-binding response OmpR family regulator
MIVDDDPSARKLVRDSLRLAGEDWDVWEADDGMSAVDVVGAMRPDVVLLDITMPELGGIPVCSEIKRDPAISQVEIVIVSARTENAFIASSLEAGASDYITKPFQPSDLVRRVKKVLAKRESAEEEPVAEEASV